MAVCQSVIPVSEVSQVGEARRVGVQLGLQAGLSESDAGRVAIVVTELANNLVKHAKGGDVLLRSFETPGGPAVETIAIDRGPGMDVSKCIRDGFSTGGTSGTGFGAVKQIGRA